MNTIYLLSDPRTNEPRYVGVTNRPLERRIGQHRSDAVKQINRPVCDWFRKLLNMGLHPIVSVLEVTPDRIREAHWIAHYRSIHDRMLNMGDGGNAATSSDPRVAAKISAALRGRKLSPEHLEKCRNRPRRKHTAETREKMRKPKSDEHREKAARALAAKRASGEYHPAKGDANGARLHPESLLRGDQSPQAKLNSDAVLEMRRLYAEGATTLALAYKYGVAPYTARRAVHGKTWSHLPGAGEPRGQGYAPKKNICAGDASPHSKLCSAQVAEMRRLYAEGLAINEIARRFSVSDTHAGKIVKRLAWRQAA